MSENLKVVENGNGIKTVSVFSSPVRYIDEAGNWRDINNNIYLNTAAKPVVYKYITTANTFTLGFKETANAPDFIRFVFERGKKGTIGLTLNGLYFIDANTDQKALIANPSAAVAQVSGDKIIYPDAFPGVILELTALMDRLKDNVIISESFKKWLPDPATLGLDPATSHIVLSYTLNSKYGQNKKEKLAFLGKDGLEYIWAEPVIAQDANGDDLAPFEQYDAATNELVFGISYPTTQTAAYPIYIDPTLYVASGAHDGWMRKSFAGAYSRYTSQSSNKVGADASYLYRHYCRFDLTSYVNQTIYGAVYGYYPTAGGTLTWDLEQIPDFGTLDATAADWDLVATDIYPNIGRALNTYNSVYVKSIIKARGGWVAFRTKATTEPTTSGVSNAAGTVNGYNSALKSFVSFNSYSTFTQNAATPGPSKVTVNWTNGGGLAAGDKHRIYYKVGTGLTAADVKADGTYVESTAYTDTSCDVPNLTAGTNYCFVVVDLQEVNGTFYEGAISNVVEASPSSAGTQVIAYADTRRSVRKTAMAYTDTRRK